MKKDFDEIMTRAMADVDLRTEDIPRIDLYMDQILTLLEEGLGKNKRREQERIVTKTMINNYSKERLIMPIKGKKYSREQMMQLVCVLILKQTLPLADVKPLMDGGIAGIRFEKVMEEALKRKSLLRDRLPTLLGEVIEHQPQASAPQGDDIPAPSDGGWSEAEWELIATLTLAAGANYMRRICEGLIDSAQPEKKENVK